jgi:viologen exporter family transport system ATP-binding protein
MKAITAKNLSKTYWYYEKEAGISGSVKALFRGKKVFVEAVREIDLDIGIGEIIGFIGPNGAGKTTTLKMLAGILYPSGGHIEVLGHIPCNREKAFLKKITFVSGQRNRLFWDLPAEDYFNFLKVVYEIPENVYQINLQNLIQLAEIGEILKVPQRKLSVGQRKRCELVGALLHNPTIIFLDEPTNAIDLINARKVREFIKGKGGEGKYTIILTSHNISDIEQVCERLIIINRGRIVYDGSMQNLTHINGFNKQIKAVFNGQLALEKIEKLGKIIEKNNQEVLMEVKPHEAATVASHLFTNFSVRDISITDPPLEKIIESIYLKS